MNNGHRNVLRGALRRSLSLLCTGGFLASCAGNVVDFDAAKKFSQVTQNAATSFDAITTQVYQTCVRYHEVEFDSVLGAATPGPVPIHERTLAAEPFASPEPTPFPTPPATIPPHVNTPGDPHCNDAAWQSYVWRLENQLVLNYVKAIGDIAGLSTSPGNFDTLSSKLKTVGLIGNDSTAKVAATVAQSIASVLLAAKRNRDLKLVIEAANAPVGSSRNGMDLILETLAANGKVFPALLRSERIALQSFYTRNMSAETQLMLLDRCGASLSPDDASPDLTCAQVLGTAGQALQPRPSCVCRALVARWNAKRRSVLAARAGIRMRGAAAELRLSIYRQRTGLNYQDSYSLITDMARASGPYVSIIQAIEKANDGLEHPARPGLRGLMDALQPYIGVLTDETTALTKATKS